VNTLCRDTSAALPKVIVTFIVLMSLAMLLLFKQPYPRDAHWKLPVKISSLLLCCVAALLNYATATDAPSAVITALAYIAVIGSAGLFAILLISFLAVLSRHLPPPPQEKPSKGQEWVLDNPLMHMPAIPRRRMSDRGSVNAVPGTGEHDVLRAQSTRVMRTSAARGSTQGFQNELQRFSRPSAVQPVHVRSTRVLASASSIRRPHIARVSQVRSSSRNSFVRVPMLPG
jgi:hypothetical protein